MLESWPWVCVLIFFLQHVYVVGGQVSGVKNKTGNVFTVPTNKFAEFNMFLDPSAAKQVFRSNLSITLLPLSTQRKVASFKRILETLKPAEAEAEGTPESNFVRRVLSLLRKLRRNESKLYHHVVGTFFFSRTKKIHISVILFLFLILILISFSVLLRTGHVFGGTPWGCFLGRSFKAKSSDRNKAYHSLNRKHEPGRRD